MLILPINPIEALATTIQALPSEDRWLSAQEDVILASGTGVPLRRGRWSSRADWLLGILGALGLACAAAELAGVALLAWICGRQYCTRRTGKTAKLLFVGIGALRDPYLVRQLERIQGETASLLNETELSTFFARRRISFFALIREWRSMLKESTLDQSRTTLALKLPYRLTQLIRIGPKVAYFRAWFRQHRREAGKSVVVGFGTASHVAYAAIAAGVEATYLPHGFMRRSIVLPDFPYVYCSNRFEAEHVCKRLPQAAVSIIHEPPRFIASERIAAIAGIYSSDQEGEFTRSFIDWARQEDVPIIVRTHPKDNSGYWDQWRGIEGVRVVDERYDFASFISAFRPRFLATWFSTTLLDAASRGVVPVILTQSEIHCEDTVFPLQRLGLQWPKQQSIIQSLLDNPTACAAFVLERYSDALGIPSMTVADNGR